MAQFQQSLESNNKTFCEMLFTKALAPYFINVHETNRDGFNSSTPNPGLWELFVYENSDPRRMAVAGSRVVRSKFIKAVAFLGKHLRSLDTKIDGEQGEEYGGGLRGGVQTGGASDEVLKHIKDKGLNQQESSLFNLFFDIVDENKVVRNKRQSVSIADYKHNASAPGSKYGLSVKTFTQSLDVPGAYTSNLKGNQQGGAHPITKLALITSYLPLLGKDSFDAIFESFLPVLEKKTFPTQSALYNPGTSRTNVDSDLIGGASAEEIRNAFLRNVLEQFFENTSQAQVEDEEVLEVVSAEEIAQYLACNPQKSRLFTPVSNIATLAALPSNTWRQLSDDSFEKWTPQGYKPLSKEECDKVLNGTCAGSSIKSGVCERFMAAVNSNNAEALVRLLREQEIWDSNTAADSLNKLHPATVLRILNALHFGTKNGPFGKRVCSVDEWMKECIKGTNLQNASPSENVKAYLQHLVEFVNRNPSLIDPSKRPFAAMTSAATPDILKQRGLFYAGETVSHGSSAPLNFSQVRQAVSATCGGVNLSSVHVPYATAYGAVHVVGQTGGQKGGNHLYTQASQAQLSLGSGIQALLSQVLNGLKSTQYKISTEEEAKINQKVASLTALEQEIYATIMELNEKRLAVQCGANFHSQVASTQERLMQLSSTYDRRAPCLQELCEQLRMLLAQQQNSAGVQPL
jgi:hypothetical protein